MAKISKLEDRIKIISHNTCEEVRHENEGWKELNDGRTERQKDGRMDRRKFKKPARGKAVFQQPLNRDSKKKKKF